MTALEFRRFLDGFGLAMLLLGCFLCAGLFIIAVLQTLGVRSVSNPHVAFQGLVLIALGGCLRLLVQIDKRLESKAPESKVS